MTSIHITFLEEVAEVGRASRRGALARVALYIALVTAWIATSGSLYMSEVLGWVPCLWCWYQRVAMYPLACVIALGLLARDRNLPQYMLGLAVPGILASTYHILLQKVPFFARFESCRVGVPCSVDYLNWLGFITIPMLAWAAFAIIMVAAVLALRAREEDFLAEGLLPGLSPAFSVVVLVAAVVAMFALSGALNARQHSSPSSALSTPDAAMSQTLPPAGTSSEAARIYNESCIGCHGPAGPGTAYIRDEFLRSKSDLALLSFMRAGRAANAPDNFSGMAMPANGGRIGLSDAQVLALIRYLREARGLQPPAP